LQPNSIHTSQQYTKRMKSEDTPDSESRVETDIESVIDEVLHEASFEYEDRVR